MDLNKVKKEMSELKAELKNKGIDINPLQDLPETAIYDRFPCEEFEVVVLDAKELLEKPEVDLLFMKVVEQNGEEVAKPLTMEEQEKAIERYNKLKKLFKV